MVGLAGIAWAAICIGNYREKRVRRTYYSDIC